MTIKIQNDMLTFRLFTAANYFTSYCYIRSMCLCVSVSVRVFMQTCAGCWPVRPSSGSGDSWWEELARTCPIRRTGNVLFEEKKKDDEDLRFPSCLLVYTHKRDDSSLYTLADSSPVINNPVTSRIQYPQCTASPAAHPRWDSVGYESRSWWLLVWFHFASKTAVRPAGRLSHSYIFIHPLQQILANWFTPWCDVDSRGRDLPRATAETEE